MVKHLAIGLLLIASSSAALAQGGKRVAAGALEGLGKGISDIAQRQIDLESEIELAKAKAAIELDLQRKLAADRAARSQRSATVKTIDQQKPVEASEGRREIEILDRSYPGWFQHAESRSFKAWIATQPEDMRRLFEHVRTAQEMMSLLNEHRLSLGMEPLPLMLK